MKIKPLLLWHPESPGMRIPVVRSWWQKLVYPEDFAILGEVLKYYAYREAFEMLTNHSKGDSNVS